jgi:hypothetical protein
MKKTQINFKIKHSWATNILLLAVGLSLGLSSCKKQLDIKDPNDPTFAANVNSEAGLAAYAQGGIFWNGFNYGDGWLGDSYFSLPWGYHELMGDVVGGGQGSNNQTTTMGVPDKFVADPTDAANTTFTNPSPQALGIIRGFNNTASTNNANNALYYEWTNMYAMLNSANLTLENMGSVSLSADKAAAVKAWAYWWKGYAYAQLGTLYYSGLIEDHSATLVSKYVDHNALIAESNKQLNLALSTIATVSNQGDFTAMMAQLIPAQNQKGHGNALSAAEFSRTINTMLARNILLNHLTPFVNGNPAAAISKSNMTPMAAADWTAIIGFCTNGIKNGDNVFTGRTSTSNSYFSPTGGSVAGITAFSNQSTTYKLSERLVQQFKTGDKRLANFSTSNGTFYGDANTNSTRYTLVDGDLKGLSGIPILGTRTPGALEIYIGPSFEENQLMLAEANIRSGNINAGLLLIDQIRNYQGANIAAVGGTGLSLSQALQELTMERQAALAFRGLSFYDSRRWGWTYSTSNGGGRYGCTLLFGGKIYTNATINYNFMDYWDVPADETTKNTPTSDSAPVINPNY